MENINYHDFYKFLVSLGVILIGLALLIPWLFLKESYNLNFNEIDLNSLSNISKEIINIKQSYLLLFARSIPWISVSFLFLGLSLVILGLLKWYKKQKLVDKKDTLDIIKLEKEIQQMSPQEIIKKAQKDSRDDTLDEILTSKEILTEKQEILLQNEHPWKKYIEIEKEITELLFNQHSDIYEILPNVKVGFIEIDILLKANDTDYYDKIIEIKYYKSGLRDTFLNIIPSNLKSALEMYKKKLKRSAVPVIIIVLRKGLNEYLNIDQTLKKLTLKSHEQNLDNLLIQFIQEEELRTFNFGKITEPVKRIKNWS